MEYTWLTDQQIPGGGKTTNADNQHSTGKRTLHVGEIGNMQVLTIMSLKATYNFLHTISSPNHIPRVGAAHF